MSHPANRQSSQESGTSILSKFVIILLVIGVIPITILVASLASGVAEYEAMLASVICQIIGMILSIQTCWPIARQAITVNQAPAQINKDNFAISADGSATAAAGLDPFRDNARSMQEEIQTSIENLIWELEEIAAGNLTIISEVNDDMTGPIANSVNHMTAQLRSIVKCVESAANQVTNFADHIQAAATTMSVDSDAQAGRIAEASHRLLEMAESFQDVAELAKESEEVAVEARQTASNGLKAVSNTIDGMQRIRDQVQSTSKRIKRLGESSQEIGEIVQLISDIADRTSILALNASIQAAMAGDAGHGFAIVAQEIEGLAERSTDATKQVSKLIRAIQNETNEVISDMEESTREVVVGSELASQAGSTLFEVDSVSDQLVELIQTSSVSVLQQALTVNQIATSMSEIAGFSKSSAETSRDSTRHVRQLADMVTQLRKSVSQFNVGCRDDESVESGLDPRPLKEESSPSSPGESRRNRKRNFEKRTRNVARTIISKDPVDQDIDNSVLQQIRAATVIMGGDTVQDARQLDNRPNDDVRVDRKTPGDDSNSRTVAQTMMLDNE